MISDEGFTKRERLLKSRDFREVYNKGRSFKKDAYILYCLPNNLGHNRLGFSISSRNIKRAYRRNRIRRIFKALYRRNKTAIRPGVDMVIVVKRDLGKSVNTKEIDRSFNRLAEKLGIAA